MAEVIRFDSAIDLATPYVVASTTGIANAEADAIVCTDIDVTPTSPVSVGGNTQCTLYIDFTKGSLTNCLIKIYGSFKANPASTEWYQEVVETDSSGAATLDPLVLTLTASARIAWHFPTGAYRALKVTVGSTGTITSSALTLNLGMRSN